MLLLSSTTDSQQHRRWIIVIATTYLVPWYKVWYSIRLTELVTLVPVLVQIFNQIGLGEGLALDVSIEVLVTGPLQCHCPVRCFFFCSRVVTQRQYTMSKANPRWNFRSAMILLLSHGESKLTVRICVWKSLVCPGPSKSGFGSLVLNLNSYYGRTRFRCLTRITLIVKNSNKWRPTSNGWTFKLLATPKLSNKIGWFQRASPTKTMWTPEEEIESNRPWKHTKLIRRLNRKSKAQ